ncbi:MAG: hypothetical protein ACXWZP_03355 [Gaiellaceae bacterium]
MQRVVLLVTAACVGALVAAASSPAAIVPQQGIGGIRLGMTKQAVQAKLGMPGAVRTGSNEIGSYTTFVFSAFEVTFFAGAKATSVTTRSAKQRTARGVGVGSTAAEVAASVPRVRCVTESSYRHCYVGTWMPGKKVSDFAIRNGRVSRVSIGYVID